MNKQDAKRVLKKFAHACGATVEDDSAGDEYCFQVVAPDGKRWIASDGHHLVVSCYRGDPKWLVMAVSDGIERIKIGLRAATKVELEDSDGV